MRTHELRGQLVYLWSELICLDKYWTNLISIFRSTSNNISPIHLFPETNHSWENNIGRLNAQIALPPTVNLTICYRQRYVLVGNHLHWYSRSRWSWEIDELFYLKMGVRDSRGNMLGCQFLQLWLQDLESALVSQLWRRIPGLKSHAKIYTWNN